MYSARLTRWLDRLAHFDININHIAGKHLALTDYLSRNPIFEAEPIDIYDEEYVINNILPLYSFIAKHGCLSNEYANETNTTDQSNYEKHTKRTTIEPEQTTHADNKTNSPLNSPYKINSVASPFTKINYPINQYSTLIDSVTYRGP